jgi:RND family efflux transporter MFP subunit
MRNSGCVLSVFITVFFLHACSEGRPQSRPLQQTFNVIVEPVQFITERTRVEAVGTSQAMRSVTLHPATSGEVVGVHFQPGQLVERGDVLVELDQRDAKLAVELAQVRLRDAERLHERYQQSAASGATLPTTLDAAKTALESARIELDRAQVNLSDRTIRAPFSGFVGITDVETGDRIQPTTAITTLDDRNALLVSFAVPELLSGKLKAGDLVEISTWNAAATRAMGEVIDIDSRINPETRVFIVRARVENSADNLRPGMSFRVRLDLAGDRYPVLSEVALQWGAEGSYVWTVENGTAQRTRVSIVQRQEGRVLVQADLNAGDNVVLEGIQRLRPGLSVNVQSRSQNDDSSQPASRVENTFEETGTGG